MISYIRLIILFIILYLTHVHYLNWFMGEGNLIGNYALSFLLVAACSVVYGFLNNYFFVYRANKQNSAYIQIIENIITPCALVYMFGYSLLGSEIISVNYLSIMLVSMLLLYGQHAQLHKFFWSRRLQNYRSIPDSGEITIKELMKLDGYVFCFLIMLPIIGRICVSLYA